MKIIQYIWAICLIIPAGVLNGQTTGSKTVTVSLPTVAIIDIESAGSKNIAMSFSRPTEAGNPLNPPAANNALWLNYTSAIASGGSSRTITAHLTAPLPGIDIKLLVAAATGGGGVLGTAASMVPVTLTASPVTIVNGIGGGYTGNGAGKGRQLTFSIAWGNSYAGMMAGNQATTIVYTISN